MAIYWFKYFFGAVDLDSICIGIRSARNDALSILRRFLFLRHEHDRRGTVTLTALGCVLVDDFVFWQITG